MYSNVLLVLLKALEQSLCFVIKIDS